ncbi:MAG: GNAT family N-acetyltransferase [Alphaproteobacteria bacterium]|nr:GNAT family N-acetyltransferase [Alphaproteobacteria bacterium]
MPETVIRPMTESDLPAARRICHSAFGTRFGAPDPENFWSDRDYVYGRFGAAHVASFTAELDGEVVGSNFATKWGSVGFFGPLTVRPDLWDRGIAQPLVRAVCDAFDGWGVSHAGLSTFPDSPKHIHLYGKFGFYPRFLTALMAAPANPGDIQERLSRYSELPTGDRGPADTACREIADALYPGLDLTAEIGTLAARGFGDTLLLWETGNRLAGFAVCHWGPASEAGDGCCFVKFGGIRPGPDAPDHFAALLDACRTLAASVGMPNLLAGVNLAREEAYRHMKGCGFRTEVQIVTMHRPNDWCYSRPGIYALDDWR